MRPGLRWALPLIVALAIAAARSAVALDEASVAAAPCAIPPGRDVTGYIVSCNFGLTSEQLNQLTKAVVQGASAPLRDRIIGIGKTLGVSTEAATTLLRIAGEQHDMPDDRQVEVLTKLANDYRRLQAQAAALAPDNPAARALVAQAKAAIQYGRLARAHALLRQATQAQIVAALEARTLHAQAAEDAQMLGAAGSTATEGAIALTERHFKPAAELFGEAAAYVPAGHPDERGRYLERQADAVYRQGDASGDKDALRRSIALYRRLLAERTRERVPLQWAKTQSDLGAALETLGKLEAGRALLEDAVAAYRAALEERTRARVPLDWAETQNDLGVALASLGEVESGTAGAREGGTARLEAAVAAYRAALEERTRARVPLQSAVTQMNLGTVLWTLAGESGTARLEAAAAAYREALEILVAAKADYNADMCREDLEGVQSLLASRMR